MQYRIENRARQQRGFKTKREAEDFAANVRTAQLRGTYVDPADSRVTVGVLGRDWLSQRGHLKPSTRRVEQIAWDVHVEPRWGATKLADIKHSAVQAWVAEMGREVLDAHGDVVKRAAGPTTIIRAANLLAGILDTAVADRRLATNPAKGIRLPRKPRRAEHRYLSDAQLWALAEQAGERGVVILLLGYCGLRWGEAAGLHVGDVDPLRRRIVCAATRLPSAPRSRSARPKHMKAARWRSRSF